MPYDNAIDPRREKIDRLLLVADALENPPPGIVYRQSTWHCGTSACALGHALIKYGQIGNLRLVQQTYQKDACVPSLTNHPPRSVDEAVNIGPGISDTFGITMEEQSEVFGVPPETVLMDSDQQRKFALDRILALHAKKVAELKETAHAV